MSNHTVDECKIKLFGKSCDSCKRRHHTAKCPPNVAQTNMIQVSVYAAEITRICGVDYVPVVQKLTIESKDGKNKAPTIAFVDPGARRSLCARAYFEEKLKPLGHTAYTGDPVIVKGVDHTGEGVRTSEYVDLTWVFPNGHKVHSTLILVPHIPEPIILGRDWQREAGTATHQGITPESCYCEFTAGELKENFLREDEYRSLINPQDKRAGKALHKRNRKQKLKFADSQEGKEAAENKANQAF